MSVIVVEYNQMDDITNNRCNNKGCSSSTLYAAKIGHLECLRYARENGCEWHPDTTWKAAENGHLECLRYAHENGCEWHPETTWGAADYANLECLRYAHDNGCEWHPETTWGAASSGNLECLKYAHVNGCEWHPATAFFAAWNGHLECLMYIYEHCGDVATWENANLEKNFEEFPEEIQAYINSVREDWEAGLNKPGLRTKSAVKG